MSFPRYPEYKDSGVEWLGEVPGHWQVQRLANLFRQVAEDGRDDLPVLTVSIHSGVSDKEFDDNELDRKVTRIEDRTSYKRVAPGDLVYNMMRAWQGGFGTVTVAGLVSPAYVVARPIKRISTFLVEQQLRTPAAVEEMRRHSRGVTDFRLRLYWEEFKTLSVVVPPPIEEAAIAAFLDRETAKIDALVAEQQNLIALLKEKRQALISHAVTKGLDPDVPMKDSGVAWLGEVPAHWLISPLKYLASSIKAGPFGSALTKDMYVASGYRVYGQEQVIPGDFTVGDYYISDGVFDELSQYAVAPGDLLISCVGTFGKIAIVPDDVEPGIINPRLIRLRVRSDVKAGFLCEVLRSQVVFEQFAVLSRGGTMDVINIGTLSNIYVPCPPFEEQQRILSFLADSLMEIDSLVAEADATIALLKERRTALISAAVTGKIDVRHLAVVPADRTPEPA